MLFDILIHALMLGLCIYLGVVLIRARRSGRITWYDSFGVHPTYTRADRPFSFWLVVSIGWFAILGLIVTVIRWHV